MEIPQSVIEAAAKAQFEWQDGLPSWEDDADGFTRAEYISQTTAAAQVIAEYLSKRLEKAEEILIEADTQMSQVGFLHSPWQKYRASEVFEEDE